MAELPPERFTLLVGSYAQERYLPEAKSHSLTERVRNSPHLRAGADSTSTSSWRSTGWMRKNLWFESELLPVLKDRIAQLLR